MSDWRIWVIVLVLLVLLALFLWWWFGRRAAQRQVPAAKVVPPPSAPAAAAPPAPDDLAIIEGIGPKITQLLTSSGISTFAQLASTDVSELKRILEQANLRIADPTTWPKQASLAAAGKWDELKAYQDRLRRGREV